MTTKKIFLWTAPRCVSTAFEFSFRTLPNAMVFHEPYNAPYYAENPIKDIGWDIDMDEINSAGTTKISTYKDVEDALLRTYSGKNLIFTKCLAYTLSGKFDTLLKDGMKDSVHTFLIRDPTKVVASSFRNFSSPEAWSKVRQNGDLGFHQLRDLYNFVKENITPNPIVVDADDLLENPEGILNAYCKEVGIEFKEGMTRWESGSMKTKEFIEQKGGQSLKWQENAFQSSGISKSVAHSDVLQEVESFPDEVKQCIKEFRVVYDEMYKFRLVLRD